MAQLSRMGVRSVLGEIGNAYKVREDVAAGGYDSDDNDGEYICVIWVVCVCVCVWCARACVCVGLQHFATQFFTFCVTFCVVLTDIHVLSCVYVHVLNSIYSHSIGHFLLHMGVLLISVSYIVVVLAQPAYLKWGRGLRGPL